MKLTTADLCFVGCHRAWLRAAGLAAALSCVAVDRAGAQAIVAIEPPPGRQSTFASAVSADGSVVAVTSGSYLSAPLEAPYRWTRDAGCQLIAPPDVEAPTWAISGDGSTIVGTRDPLGPSFIAVGTQNFQAVQLSQWNDRITLTGLSGDGGFACGSAEFTIGSHPVNAFRRSNATGTYLLLGILPGMNYSRAHGMTPDGSVIVGSSGLPSPFDFDCRAFRWSESDGIQDLGVLPGANESWALAVSADGSTIVGHCRGPDDRMRATRWRNGGIAPMAVLANTHEGTPRAVSADGAVIVGSTGFIRNGFELHFHATMWSRYTGVVDLNGYLPYLGVDLTGWVLQRANGVSADGRTIVGDGSFNGAQRGFVLTLPPPCGTADFNNDADHGTDADIQAFFACLGGDCCPTCPEAGADFDGDGVAATDADIESFFRVLAGGSC